MKPNQKIEFPPGAAPGFYRWRAGYTLFELLLVLAILVVIALLAVPNADRVYENYRFRQATARIKTNLAAARIHAIDTGVPCAFRFEPGGTHYVIDGEAATARQTGQSENGARPAWKLSEKLPAGFQFQAPGGGRRYDRLRAEQFAGFEHAEDLALISWSRPLWFYPDGTADDRILEIADARRRTRISVRGLTGDVSLELVAPKTEH